MLFHLVRLFRGKETVMMTDTLPRVNARKKQLSSSQRKGVRGQATTYTVRPAAKDAEKYRKPSADMYLSGQPRVWPPRVPKK